MDFNKLKSRISVFWILHIAGWLAYSGTAILLLYRGIWTDIFMLLIILIAYTIGFLTCIPLRFFYKKIRFHERPLKYSIMIAVAASFIGANVWLGIEIVVGLIIRPPYEPEIAFLQGYVSFILTRGIPLLGWTFLYFGIKIRREWKRQEQRTEKANFLAQSAQLQMLRYQINPHFLFNSMNSIRALIDENETKAKEMITELSEFLRYSLVSKDYSDVPLKYEMEAIQHYLAIQKKRYEDKLEVHYEIEPQSGEYPVLSFLVHPLVENAIKYGMHTSSMPLIIHLKAKIRDGVLRIEVCNTGKWIESARHEGQRYAGTGTGLDNVRRRLENAFPGRHRLHIFEKEGRVHVHLEIRMPTGEADEKNI
ncbi:MAG: histidine kinase [Candidatus Aminicenantales bacterium]